LLNEKLNVKHVKQM